MLPKHLLSVVVALVASFGLVACLDEGSGDPELDQLTENVALPPPANLTATPINPNRIDLAWDAVNDPSLKYYVVYRGPTPGSETTLTSIPPTTTTMANDHLTPGTQYCYFVRTVTMAGERSVPSNEVCVSTPSQATTQPPATVTATAISDTRITVSWSAVSGATVYHVFMAQGNGAFSQIASVSPPSTSVTIANLQPSTTYRFYVTAVTINGESQPSAIATATTFALGLEGYWKFDEKMGTSAMDASGFGRNFALTSTSWSTNRPPVRLTKNMSSLSVSSGATSAGTTTSQGAFRFAGAAFTFSGWVNLPAAVDTDIIGMRNASCGTLGWKLSQTSANQLNISGGGGTRSFGQSIPVNTWTHVAFTYANGTLTMYINGAQVAQSAYTPNNPLTSAPLTVGHVGGCAGGAVLVDEVRIFSRALTSQEIASYGAVPPAPTLSGTAPDASHIVLNWNAVPNAVQYYVYKGTAPGNETFATTVPSNTFTGQHLTPNTQYTWYVRAEVGELDSPNSNEVVLTTPDLPSPPATVNAVANSSTRVTVSWSAVTNAQSYRVYKSTNGGAYTLAATVVAPGLSVQLANLTTMTMYSFEVVTVDTGGNVSTFSSPASVTTP
jgi:fibronectin type 3 domain-containing protein